MQIGSGQFRPRLGLFCRLQLLVTLRITPMAAFVVLIVAHSLSVLVMVLSLCGVSSSFESVLVATNGECTSLHGIAYGIPWKGAHALPSGERSSPKQDEADARESSSPMDKADEEYEQQSDFIQRVNKHPTLSHLGNEKKLFSLLTAYDATPPANQHCSSMQGIGCFYPLSIDAISYLQLHNSELLIHCKDNRTLSHCQQYYLFRYDTRNQVCEPFYRKPCSCCFSE